MGKRVADQLVETIGKAGIKRIYAVTGDSLNEVNDAVRRNGSIEWIHVRHEESGAFAAAAEAELNGIACCAGSSGPGHVHLINGLYDAHRSGASVLAIASTCSSEEFGTGFFQETNPGRLFDDCSGYNQTAFTACQFARMLPEALRHTIRRKEVAVIGLPGDVAAAEAADSPGTEQAPALPSVCRPQDEELRKLAQMISCTQKITIFCGIGACDAHDEVVRLAATIKAPVAYSFKAKMAIQYENPYQIGMTGLLGLPSAYISMHESELLLLLGTDFPYTSFIPDNCQIVQVDTRPERIGRRAKVTLGMHGDIRQTLQALLPLLKEHTSQTFLDRQLKIYSRLQKEMAHTARKCGREGQIAPEYAAVQIDRLAARNAIFTLDTGMCCVWGARYLQATGQREILGSFNHGSMANALPMAIGAALARPEQQVVALCGDGGLSMLLGDLATIVQYKLPIKIIVFNNRSLGMVKLEMQVAGLPDWQTKMLNPDFAAVAQAMGISGYRVTDPEQVKPTLERVFAAEGPVLVDLHTDADALAMPPKIELAQMAGFTTAMAKLILAGRGQEVLAVAKSNFKHIWELV